MSLFKPKDSNKHSDAESVNNGGAFSMTGRGATPEQKTNNKTSKTPGDDFQGINKQPVLPRVNSYSYTS